MSPLEWMDRPVEGREASHLCYIFGDVSFKLPLHLLKVIRRTPEGTTSLTNPLEVIQISCVHQVDKRREASVLHLEVFSVTPRMDDSAS